MSNQIETHSHRAWIFDLLFVLVLVLAGWLRLTGADWGELQHQHPDENTFSGVLGAMRAQKCVDELVPVDACPVEQRTWLSLGDYFNSDTSTLNPYNRGYGSFVYGNLPMTLVRIAADMNGPIDLRLFGRQASAFADLFAIVFLYFMVARLYDRRVALLAALFSALAAMQIQQSHFFTVDLFVNTFAVLASYFAVEIMRHVDTGPKPDAATPKYQLLFSNRLFLLSIAFGVAYGMALASKVNIYPLAVLLPGAFVIRYFTVDRRNVSAGQMPQESEAGAGAAEAQGSSSWVADYWSLILACLIAGGLVAVVSFRIFQPYAFNGLGLDERWVADITQQRAQATGTSDMPWSLQWARRSHLYSFTNLTLYGLGLPLGILAWIGFLYMGWRILKGEWQHALLWGWTAAYFVWQSMQFNPTMRYQLPIYPMLAMMAAWFVFEKLPIINNKLRTAYSILRPILAFVVIALTVAWAFAFQSIYLRAEPRIAATRWIYQNVPGPINLPVETEQGEQYNQPLALAGGIVWEAQPYRVPFIAQRTGSVQEITLAHVAAVPNQSQAPLAVTVWQNLSDAQPLTSALAIALSEDVSSVPARQVFFEQQVFLTANQTYYLKFELADPNIVAQVCGTLSFSLQTADQVVDQFVELAEPCEATNTSPFTIAITPGVDGLLSFIQLANVTTIDLSAPLEPRTLQVTIVDEVAGKSATASLRGTFDASNDPRGDTVILKLDQPFDLVQGTQYIVTLEVSAGALTVSGATIANETDFDYGLPFRLDGYDAFGGIYRGENLQVYWDDNADKLDRYVTTLEQIDYIFIPTNHQYAQLSRVPERYPLTAYYYRELMGCPPELETIPCYHEAKPGDHTGRLGFDLVAVFETYPKLGTFEINDEYAEEAFTFYDHPKVLIFKKNANFDPEQVRASLSTVDLSKMVRLLPTQFDDYATLQLSPDRLAPQRAGGTWSDLFNYAWIQNRQPVVGLLMWYLFIFGLGLITYPLVRVAMPGLADKGYPLSRALGLVLFGYLVWLAGSAGIAVTRPLIAAVFGALVLVGAVVGHLQRAALIDEWQTNRKYFLMVEGLFLAFFLIDVFIRLGNPDLWHPFKGGERPMDFSYFNAVLKSTTFPPYDPWFAGGYINYYYYGFVLVGMPVKLLGIVPTIAYNFILPTLFAMVGICAFSIGWNLISPAVRTAPAEAEPFTLQPSPFISGLSAAFFTVLLGNLGTLQLIYNQMQNLGAQGTFAWESTFAQRLGWAYAGLKMLLNGASLPIGPGNWYWDPSRVVPPGPGNAITEFPLFTFLYSDLHGHMMVMPIALLALAWALSVVKTGALWQSQAEGGAKRWLSILVMMLVGGLVIGAAYPTNLSDAYTYLLVGMAALVYANLRADGSASLLKRFGWAAGAVVVLYVLSTYLYQPYRASYAQAYSALDPWKGPFTPLASYFTHWGLFLFCIVAWLAWETREWMANTPASALQKLKPYQLLIEGGLIGLLVLVLGVQYIGSSVAWVALPIAAWAGIMLLNPRLSEAQKLALFLIGTALFITVLVEVVVVRGDIGRQNTIFKFYMQAWLMLAVSAGAALAWTFPAFFKWLPGWRVFWQTAMVLLVAGAALFTITGTTGKVRDRWVLEAPHTFDSITYMQYTNYDTLGQRLDLSFDYRAIRWLQDNVQGSPVIVEANCVEYGWCTRMTIYTGLPGVVGWNFHQRQQRAFNPQWVEQRVLEIGNFYNSLEPDVARDFLAKYQVKYIIVGPLEYAAYLPEGIAKFAEYNGVYWQSVYTDGPMTIYEVLP